MFISANGANAKIGNATDILGTATDITSTALLLVSGLQDAKKRREFEQALAYLSSDQEKVLDRQLLNAKNDVDRLKIISDVLAKIQIARINQIYNSPIEEERKKRTKTSLFIGGVLIFGGVMAYLIYKKA